MALDCLLYRSRVGQTLEIDKKNFLTKLLESLGVL
jgi:hypothetical protein